MKNTKNTLLTGIALATALFASVQVTAMNPNKPVNPYLTDKQKQRLVYEIKQINHTLHSGMDPKLLSQGQKEYHKKLAQQLEGFEEIYYSQNKNDAFTNDQFDEIINLIKTNQLTQ